MQRGRLTKIDAGTGPKRRSLTSSTPSWKPKSSSAKPSRDILVSRDPSLRARPRDKKVLAELADGLREGPDPLVEAFDKRKGREMAQKIRFKEQQKQIEHERRIEARIQALKAQHQIAREVALQRQAAVASVARGKPHVKLDEELGVITLVKSQTGQVKPRVIPGLIGMEFEVSGATPVSLSKSDRIRTKHFQLTNADPDTPWYLEVDSDQVSDLEFVTHPLQKWSELENALGQMIALAEAVRAGAEGDGPWIYHPDLAHVQFNWTNEDEFEIRLDRVHFRAKMQTTQGIKLDKVSDTLREWLEPETAAKVARISGQVAAGGPVSPSVQGLIGIIVSYIVQAGDNESSIAEGPKEVFRVMARTDFCSMYNSLSPREQEQFKRCLFLSDGNLRPDLETRLEYNSEIFVYSKTYKTRGPDGHADGGKSKGPKIGDWLQSIVDGREKDLMSPPPGIPVHGDDRGRNYSMGAYEMHGDNALFEMRSYSKRSGYPILVELNTDIVEAARRAFRQAKLFTPSLEYDSEADDTQIDAWHRMNVVRHEISEIVDGFERDLKAMSELEKSSSAVKNLMKIMGRNRVKVLGMVKSHEEDCDAIRSLVSEASKIIPKIRAEDPVQSKQAIFEIRNLLWRFGQMPITEPSLFRTSAD